MNNFEKFKTAEDRAKAFSGYCSRQDCNECWNMSPRAGWSCLLKWLDLEAEEEKPLPCPFCGSGTYVNEGRNGYGDRLYSVNCACGYRTKENFRNREVAIAAHNRVARAVMEAEKKGG